VAALALATLYYGGDAFNKGASQAQAAKVANQAQQLLGAAELFYAQNGRWSNDLAELVSTGYLKSIPVAQAGGVAPALADNLQWTQPVAQEPVFLLEAMDTEPCREVNNRSFGLDGVLPRLHAGYTLQCFSPAVDDFVVGASRNTEHLEAVAAAGTLAGGAVVTTPPRSPRSRFLRGKHL